MRLFEALDELNQLDEENKTSHVAVCPDIVSVNQRGQNGTVTMGVPGFLAQDIAINEQKHIVLLIVINRAEYDKISKI